MLNKNGIPKPSFFAIRFLMSLSNHVVFVTENCLIAIINGSRIQLLLHNSKQFNYRYFLIPENEISYKEIDTVFVETEKQTISVNMINLPHKKWQVKINEISETHGSLLKEWENIGFGPELGREEIDYLSRIIIPKLTFSNEAGTELTIQRELTPNEFCLIEVVKR